MTTMQLKDFDFNLPADRIAKYPLPTRSESKCMHVSGNAISHFQFRDILQFIHPGDLLVFNNTKVIPARIFGKKRTGGQVEILVERLIDHNHVRAFVRASKAPHIGDYLYFADNVQLKITDKQDQFYELELVNNDRALTEIIESIGQIPLPPYMHRSPNENDKIRYQTVYAKEKGSVAAPTAGFHFDETLLQQLRLREVQFAYLTLHIGAGTFAPVRVQNIVEHKMHAEYLEISAELCEQVKATKSRGNRVIAVGTTSLRALETAYKDGELKVFSGDTNIFICPGHIFQSADALITNLHLPQSTLLMLVCAFGGYENLMQAYQAAIENDYRFYSYGDAMLIDRLDG